MAQAAKVMEAPPEILKVALDPSGNPKVKIDDRNKHANSGAKIKWLRESGAPNFEFVGFNPTGAEFGIPEIMEHKIECDFETSREPNSKHYYTIFVKFDGATYHSDEIAVRNPDEGRAVIRN